MALKLKTAGKTLVFRPSGEVAVIDGGGEQVKGKWTGVACPGQARRNAFAWALDGAAQAPLPAAYSFDDNNQLQVVLQAPEGKSEPGLLPGGIEIDDRRDIVYRLVDGGGNPAGGLVTLYGDLSFESETGALRIDLEGGGQATVTGDNGIASLEAAQNEVAKLAADDLLRFRATTGNTFDDGGFVEVRARLDFPGSWDVQDGRLVFRSTVTTDPAHPGVKIGFGGKLGAVTAGFVYFADAAGTQAAFTIRGQHIFNGAAAGNDFNWLVSLGYSGKRIAAKVDFDVHRTTQIGQRLSLAGRLTLCQASGSPVSMSLALEAQYAWQDHALVFKALVKEEAGVVGYDLMLHGRFHFDQGNITFEIHYSNATGAGALTIDLAFQGDKDNFLKAVAFHLRVSPGKVEATLTARFSVRQRFVAGVGRVLEEAAPVA